MPTPISLPTNYQRLDPFPLDVTSVFSTLSALTAYAFTNPTAYPGQIVAVSGNDTGYIIKADKTVTALGAGSFDGTTLKGVVSADGPFLIGSNTVPVTGNLLVIKGGNVRIDGVDLTTPGTTNYTPFSALSAFNTDGQSIFDLRGESVSANYNLSISNSGFPPNHFMKFFGGREGDPRPFIVVRTGTPLRLASYSDFWNRNNDFTEYMRVDTATGNVGIGTQTPGARLVVQGTVSATQFVGPGIGGGSGADTAVRSLTSKYESTYTTVNSNSASWNVNAYLPLSGGNVVGPVTFSGTISGNGTTTSFNQGSASGDVSFAANKGRALGSYSSAFGLNTVALGYASYTEGEETSAYGTASHAEGKFNRAVANFSHAEGVQTIAEGFASHTEGQQTYAYGTNSHAEGTSNQAIGSASHAEGQNTKAYGAYSHTEGSNLAAYGDYSHAEGYFTAASGTYSHAEGGFTYAIGTYSHAEGRNSVATGDSGGHAEGYYATAAGNFGSHAEGRSTNASGDASHAEGTGTATGKRVNFSSYSAVTRTFTFTPETSAEFAYAVAGTGIKMAYFAQYSGFSVSGLTTVIVESRDPSNGDITITSDGPDNPDAGFLSINGYLINNSGANAHAEGQNTTAYGIASHAEGFNTLAAGNYTHAEGYETSAVNVWSHAEGHSNMALGSASHVEGFRNIAIGSYSHAEGRQNVVTGTHSHAEGYFNSVSGSASHVEGQFCHATGSYSHAEGSGCSSLGDYSHAENGGSVSNGDVSHAEGYYTRTFGYASHAEGYQATANGYASHSGGYRSYAAQDYTYAWSDGNLGTLTTGISTTRTGQYMVSASGGVFIPGNLGIGTDDNNNALTVVGTISASGSITSNGNINANSLTVPVSVINLTTDRIFVAGDTNDVFHFDTTAGSLTAFFPADLPGGFNVAVMNTGTNKLHLSASPILKSLGSVLNDQYAGAFIYKSDASNTFAVGGV